MVPQVQLLLNPLPFFKVCSVLVFEMFFSGFVPNSRGVAYLIIRIIAWAFRPWCFKELVLLFHSAANIFFAQNFTFFVLDQNYFKYRVNTHTTS